MRAGYAHPNNVSGTGVFNLTQRIPRGPSPLDLRPKDWRPSEERQAQMDDYLWDREVMRVYCDCSASHHLRAFGIAASFVFDGSVSIRSRLMYDRALQLMTTVGELRAILYAIEQAKVVLNSVATTPESVSIYSDVDHIDYFLHDEGPKTFEEIRCQIAKAQTSFTHRWPTINLGIYYLPPVEQKHNPFYSAAHNTARREVSMKKR